MDETLWWVEPVGDNTVDERVTKTTVAVSTGGKEKERVTVVLTCFADGTKLPPIIIFRGKRNPTQA